MRIFRIYRSVSTKNGCTRFVVLIRRYAIKVPQFRYNWTHFLQGLLANIQEVRFSSVEDDRICPVKFHIPGGWMIIMPRCEPLSPEDFSNLDFSRFHPNSREEDVYNIPVEIKESSFGYYKGKIVAVDYGS